MSGPRFTPNPAFYQAVEINEQGQEIPLIPAPEPRFEPSTQSRTISQALILRPNGWVIPTRPTLSLRMQMLALLEHYLPPYLEVDRLITDHARFATNDSSRWHSQGYHTPYQDSSRRPTKVTFEFIFVFKGYLGNSQAYFVPQPICVEKPRARLPRRDLYSGFGLQNQAPLPYLPYINAVDYNHFDTRIFQDTWHAPSRMSQPQANSQALILRPRGWIIPARPTLSFRMQMLMLLVSTGSYTILLTLRAGSTDSRVQNLTALQSSLISALEFEYIWQAGTSSHRYRYPARPHRPFFDFEHNLGDSYTYTECLETGRVSPHYLYWHAPSRMSQPQANSQALILRPNGWVIPAQPTLSLRMQVLAILEANLRYRPVKADSRPQLDNVGQCIVPALEIERLIADCARIAIKSMPIHTLLPTISHQLDFGALEFNPQNFFGFNSGRLPAPRPALDLPRNDQDALNCMPPPQANQKATPSSITSLKK